MQADRKRIAAFDIAKGIAIILVVYRHCLRGLEIAGSIPPASWWQVSDYVIYTFHMPLFFVISGYLLDRRSSKNPRRVWIARLRTIVYPYLVWSLIHGGLLAALSGSGLTNSVMPFSDLLKIGWAPLSPFWFLYALFFAYGLVAVFARLPAGALLALAFAAFCLAYASAPQLLQDIAYGFLYVSFGIFLREKGLFTRLPCSRSAVVGAWSLFALMAAACYRLGIPERLPFPAALAGIAAVLISCLALERNFATAAATRLLEILGQCSMSIFVMHIIILGGMRVILMRVLHLSDPALVIAFATLAAILIAAGIQIVAIRLGIENLVALPSSGRPVWTRKPPTTAAAR